MKNKCIDCKKEIHVTSIRCRSCNSKFYSSGSKNGMYNKKHTEETREKIRQSRLGTPSPKKLPPVKCIDCNKEIWRGFIRCKSCAQKGEFKKLKNGHSKEAKRKISLGHGGTGIPGENTEYGAEFDNALKEKIRFRDKYKCQLCGCSQLENGRQLDVHHINYDKKNSCVNNLISLCKSCHSSTNVRENKRIEWINFFKSKGTVRK